MIIWKYEITEKVRRIEVKRCFVLSQLIRWKKRHKGHLSIITREEYLKKLASANKKIMTFSEKKLDRIIAKEWVKRLHAYNNNQWYMGEVKTNEIGVWKRAGEMPLSWTNGSLAETAASVERALQGRFKRRRIRAARAIPGILKTSIDVLQEEKYLLPIIFKGGTGTEGRRGLKRKMKGDIDDGCMRSIALAISGVKTIKAYIGIPLKKKQRV